MVSGVEVERELSVHVPGSEYARMRNDTREYTVCFKMPSDGHYYITLTVYAFKEPVCDWFGLVNGCYILDALFLDSQLLPFCSEFLLKMVNESHENIRLEAKQAIEPSMLVKKQKASRAGIIASAPSSKSSGSPSMWVRWLEKANLATKLCYIYSGMVRETWKCFSWCKYLPFCIFLQSVIDLREAIWGIEIANIWKYVLGYSHKALSILPYIDEVERWVS